MFFVTQRTNPFEYSGFGTVSVLSHACKVLLNVILSSLKGKVEGELSEEQRAFRRGAEQGKVGLCAKSSGSALGILSYPSVDMIQI